MKKKTYKEYLNLQISQGKGKINFNIPKKVRAKNWLANDLFYLLTVSFLGLINIYPRYRPISLHVTQFLIGKFLNDIIFFPGRPGKYSFI